MHTEELGQLRDVPYPFVLLANFARGGDLVEQIPHHGSHARLLRRENDRMHIGTETRPIRARSRALPAA